MGSALKPGGKKGSRGNPPCGVKGRSSLVGFGATPQLLHGRPFQRKSQQRCRQRSVPASNFARPQTRPQAALPTTCILSRQMGATEQLLFPIINGFSRNAGISPLRRRVGDNENRRSLQSPPTPLCGAHAHAWLLSWQGKTTLAGVNPAIIALLWGGNPR